MQITDVTASVHQVDADPLIGGESRKMPFTFVEVETDDGTKGYGEAGVFPAHTMATHVNEYLAPKVTGTDPFDTESIREAALGRVRVPPGLQSAALSMVDLALWDIRGKSLGEPVWRLLGGTDPTVDVYVTLGAPIDELEALADAAAEVVSNWSSHLKMVVRDDETDTPASDAERVRVVREAIGDDAMLALDANSKYSVNEALELINRVVDYDIGWFEEPVYTNDHAQLAKLRERSSIPIAAGQFSGHRSQHWELVSRGAIDICQPNVCYVGGITEGQKVVGLAESANLDIAHAGGWPYQNMQLVGGAANGWLLEFHTLSGAIGRQFYDDPPLPKNGTLQLPDQPGLGLTPDPDVRERSQIA